MLLAVDVGNTQTVIGLYDQDILRAQWRIATKDTMTADEIRVKLESLFALSGKHIDDVTSVVIGSVVPNLTDTWELVANTLQDAEPLIVDHTIDSGITYEVDNPAELGADRLATMVAAVDRYGTPLIIVDFGTATTLDVVSCENEYLGGTIAPGIETSANALFSHAARLSEVELEQPPSVLGTDTITQIQAGVLLGEAVKVDGLVRLMMEHLGKTPRVVATGGLAPKVVPITTTITDTDNDLTLDGLLILAKRNRII